MNITTTQSTGAASRLPEALFGNDELPDSTVLQIKSDLSCWHDKLRDIKGTIAVLRLTLATLHKQQEKLEKFICSFDPVFAPIRRLPDDVLGEIFYHCLPTHRNPIPITSTPPLVLTLVCRKWRTVAISSPKLWTKLHVAFQSSVTERQYDPNQQFSHRWQLRLAGIKTWLSRSGNLPLSISLKGVIIKSIGKESHHIEREALQALVDHSLRWQALEISMTKYSLNTLFDMLDINQRTVPLLRSLRIVEDDSWGITHFVDTPHYQRLAPAKLNPLDAWLSLPALREIHTGFHHLHISAQQDSLQNSLIRCSMLSSLSLYFPTYRQIIADILRCCPSLHHCHLSVTPAWSPLRPNLNSTMILLPELRSLVIEGEGHTHDSLFSLLDAPALVELSFHLGSEMDFTFTMAPFLLRCKSLDKLTFSPGGVGETAFLDIVKSVPTITHLVFDNSFFASAYMSSRDRKHMKAMSSKTLFPMRSACVNSLLSLSKQSRGVPDNREASGYSDSCKTQRVLPNLKSFTASMKVGEDENPHSLLKFLKERIHPPSPSSSRHYPCASLEFVTLILDGHPGIGSESHQFEPVDLSVEVPRHAESVGRRVGVDIYLDISYTWQSLYEDNAKLWTDPDVLLSPKKGLDEETDHTWRFDDTYT
ncbi:hypothetical protein BJ165DRAFT_1372430 [Panaeolus papilionaceus]|nr:hypothetical protein BJ165DRAFT_1372430 [Panaeolus papilionaceus]